MPPDDRYEISELQREWRREVSDTLKELRLTCTALNLQLTEIRDQFARERDLELVEKRVLSLETDRAKIIGGMFILQAVGTGVIWFIMKIWGR